MSSLLSIFITAVGSVLASSGIWAYFMKRLEKKDTRTQMLIGLGHDRIIFLGMSYIERGWITKDEYENIHDYLFVPYKALGGNGSAERVMKEVDKLPIKNINKNSKGGDIK